MERATQERLIGASLLIVAGVIMIPWLLDGQATAPSEDSRALVLPGGEQSGNETRRIVLDLPEEGARGASRAVRDIDPRTVRAADDNPTVSLPPPAQPEPAAAAPTDSASTAEVPARFRTPMPAESEPERQVPVVAATAPSDSSTTTLQNDAPDPAPEAPAEAVTTPQPARTSPAPAVAATPPASEASGIASGWVVQVGSFASQSNAERLAETLQGKNYRAFVARNVIDGRVRFRVRVGPVAERSEADLLAAALREDRQPARILSYP